MQKEVEKKTLLFELRCLSVVGAIAFPLGIYYLYNLQTAIFFVLQALLAISNQSTTSSTMG
jgi:hypothetical protein